MSEEPKPLGPWLVTATNAADMLTVRDQFAAAALPILAEYCVIDWERPIDRAASRIATMAYAIADAMLERRRQS